MSEPLLEHRHDCDGVGEVSPIPHNDSQMHQTTGAVAYPPFADMLGTSLPIKQDSAQNIADSDKSELAPKRVSVLTEAQGLVHGARNAAYGSPLSDYSRTAGMVSAMLAHKLKEPLTAEDCIMVMICVKLSRQQNKPKRDNAVDGAGYFECLQWAIDDRAERG